MDEICHTVPELLLHTHAHMYALTRIHACVHNLCLIYSKKTLHVSYIIKITFQGFFGCAVGKAKQNAKTEIEKLKLKDLSCKDLVKEAAKM